MFRSAEGRRPWEECSGCATTRSMPWGLGRPIDSPGCGSAKRPVLSRNPLYTAATGPSRVNKNSSADRSLLARRSADSSRPMGSERSLVAIAMAGPSTAVATRYGSSSRVPRRPAALRSRRAAADDRQMAERQRRRPGRWTGLDTGHGVGGQALDASFGITGVILDSSLRMTGALLSRRCGRVKNIGVGDDVKTSMP